MRFHRICAREINNDCRGTIRRPTFIGGIPRTGHVSGHMLDVLHWLPFQDQVVFRISALAWRYLLGLVRAHQRDLCYLTSGYTRLQFPPINGTGVGGTLCPFCPYFNSPDSCSLCGWLLCLVWAYICCAIAP